MSFNIGSGATMPVPWLFENGDGESFAGRDIPRTSTHPETANGSSKIMAMTAPGVSHARSVDHKQGFSLDLSAINDFPTNAEFFNDLQMLFPSMTEEDEGVFSSEDNARVNSFPLGTLVEFQNPFSNEGFTGSRDHARQGSSLDVAIASDQFGPPPAECPILNSPISNHPMGTNLGVNGFRPLPQLHYKFGKDSSKSQTWEQNLACDPGTAILSNSLSKTDSPLSEQQVNEAYCQLEINYRFKPHLTKAQLQALAVVVELPYDEVQRFYEQKQLQPPLYVSNSSQSDYVKGPKVSNPAKRHRGSDSSSSSIPVDSGYGTSRSDSNASLQMSERNAIPRALSLRHQVREPSQKLYECTWRDCQKSFASKSDWKRHEEVHCPQWYWTCTYGSWSEGVSFRSIPCTRRFKRDDHLREHLKKDHKCADPSKVEAGRQSLIPPNPFNQQCGFCGHITRGWLDRIGHIAEHFKNGKTMSEWRDPWPEDFFEEGSVPSDDDDDDDNGKRDADGKNNSHSKSHKKYHTEKDSRYGDKKRSNTDTPGGGYQGFSNGYVRPGSFGIKYPASSRASDISGGLKRRDDAFLIDNAESLSSIWYKVRNLFKPIKEKETASASSQKGTKAASSEASRDAEGQDGERIEFYCVLCLKIVSMDPFLRSIDESFCNCSEAAIKEHIISLTNSPRELPSRYETGEVMESELRMRKGHSNSENFGDCLEMDKSHDPYIPHVVDKPEGNEEGRKRVPDSKENEDERFVALKKDMRQLLVAKEADYELSYAMQRYLNITSLSEDSCKGGEYPNKGYGLRSLPPPEAAASFEKVEIRHRQFKRGLSRDQSRSLLDQDLNVSLPSYSRYPD